jgi:oxaloacetate decarboxylase gamma subunit
MEPAVLDLLSEGVKLTVIGMTIVFAFLLLLVGALFLLSTLVARLGPRPQPLEALPRGEARAPGSGVADPRLGAVIDSAIREYRRRHRP